MSPVEDLVKYTETAAFSSGSDGTITAWNTSLERLLGISRDDALGRRCCNVIAGRDVFGNDFCDPRCIPWRMAVANRPIHPYRLTITDDGDDLHDVRVVIIRSQGETGTELVHLLHPVKRPPLSEGRNALPKRGGATLRHARPSLTARELDIARLLHQGYSTRSIASSIGISATTVRNHIAHCLHKLNAHSRIEAVAVARRFDLV